MCFSYNTCDYIPYAYQSFYYQLMHKRIGLKRSIEIYIKITPKYFSVITIIRELCELVHIVPSLMMVITTKHVGVILM